RGRGAVPESNLTLVDGLAYPLVMDPKARGILRQIDRGVRTAVGCVVVNSVLKGGDGGAGRNVIAFDLAALFPQGTGRRAGRLSDVGDTLAGADALAQIGRRIARNIAHAALSLLRARRPRDGSPPRPSGGHRDFRLTP